MTTATPSRFLDLPALIALQHMRFTTRHRVEGAYGGRHRSRQLGSAGEFVDYREYAPGEDLRRLDWKVLARTGKSYVRLYQDETNLLCTLAIDVSRSMLFGSHRAGDAAGSKLEFAQYLATALSQIISHGQDQVGLAVLADRLIDAAPPGGTLRHVAHLQQLIEGLAAAPSTTLAPALRTLYDRTPRRGVLLLFSDFLVDDLGEVFAAIRLFRHRQFEVVVLHLVHPEEERLPDGGHFRFEELEDGSILDCSPAEIRADYELRFESHAAAVRAGALANGCDYRRVSTAVPYLQVLGGVLVERTG
jgi:uncharacterized protein (DUF58 family)